MRFTYEDEGQKHEFQLHQGEFKIGRDPSCEIATTNRSVSRKHVVITVKGTTVMVKDEASGNGMFVNDVRMPEAVLKNGDVLRAGKFALTFEGEADDRTIVGSGGADQEGTLVEGAGAAPPPPRRAPSAQQREAAGHKTAPLDDVRDELARMAAAPPPPKKSKPVEAEPGPPAKIKVVKGMTASTRDLKGRLSLGTQDDNSLVLTGDGISRNHTEIVVKDGKWVVRDLASRNGTYVNGKKVDEHVLADGDSIQIGSVGLTFASSASSPAAAAVAPAGRKEAAAAPPPSKTAADPAADAKRKKMLLIGIGVVGLIVVFGLLANMKDPEEAGGGNGGEPNGGAAAAAKFEEDAWAAWGEVYTAMDGSEYKGAAGALNAVRDLYKGAEQDEAEVKAWAKVIDQFQAAGVRCVNLNGQGWDELKATLDAAAAAGPFMAKYAEDRSAWCIESKKVWEDMSLAQEAENLKKWADAVAHYRAVPDGHACYGDLAKQALKNAMDQWKKDYVDKLNQLDNAGDYEQCVATHKDMLKNIPDSKGDRKLFERYEKWNNNLSASRRKKAADQLIAQGKYEEALRELDAAVTTDDKLLAEIEKLRGQAMAGGTVSEVNKLYKEGKADEALARLGEVADQPILAQLKQKITRVVNAYKDAQAAEERKDFVTAKRWWNEIVSAEEERDNFYRLTAEQKAGFDPTAQAAELTQQADGKMANDDYVGARELAEQAINYVPGYEAAQRIINLIVKEAESRYRFLYSGWKDMPVEEALKKAQEIKAMFRASDGKTWKGVNDLIERIQKESGK